MTFAQDVLDALAPMLYDEPTPITNLNLNGGFGADMAGYTTFTATTSIINTDGIIVPRCCEVTSTGAGGQINANNPQPIVGAPIAVKTYTASIYVKAVGSSIGKSIHFQMNCNGGAFGNAGIASADVVLTDKWQRIAITGTVDHTDRTALIWFAGYNGGVTGDKFRITACQLEEGSIASDYVDTAGVPVTSAGPLTTYITGIAQPFELVEEWASDTDDDIGWSLLLDIDRAPDEALPWLAQIVGMTLDTSLSVADQRIQIHQANNWKRGTPGAIQAAPLPYLTGSKTVILRERFDGTSVDAPYYMQVATLASETPPEDFATTNLHTNPSYEVNAGGVSNEANMTINGVVNAIGTGAVRPVDGVGALSVFTTGASGSGGSLSLFRQDGSRIPVTAGQVYTWSFHTWMAAFYAPGRSVRAWLLWYDAGGASIGATLVSATTPISATQATRIALTATAPSNAVTARTGWELTSSVTANEVYLIDAIQFEQNPVATPFTTTSRPIGQGPVGAAIRAQKPAGIILTYTILSGQDFLTLRTNYATFQAVKNAYLTLNGVRSNVPGT